VAAGLQGAVITQRAYADWRRLRPGALEVELPPLPAAVDRDVGRFSGRIWPLQEVGHYPAPLVQASPRPTQLQVMYPPYR
jgi:hypothetical protein